MRRSPDWIDTHEHRVTLRGGKPRPFDALRLSPARNLVIGLLFVASVSAVAVISYVQCGWPVGDALYMTVLTVFTVGFDEVRPIDTATLRGVTIGLIVCGCTGMIFVTGALVQFITLAQIQATLGIKRMTTEINSLASHVIVCGFGRIGQMLARDLGAGGIRFVIIERSEARAEQARLAGLLVIIADATDEETLKRAGVLRARALATVLPNDSANVFITLSARALNPKLTIIARGEAPSTESKLRHAGADEVVLPAHIGAERIAELLLFSGAMSHRRDSARMRGMEAELRQFGLEFEVVVAQAGELAGHAVGEVERLAEHAFFIVAIERQDGSDISRPDAACRIEVGDGVVLVGRGGRAGMMRAFARAAE